MTGKCRNQEPLSIQRSARGHFLVASSPFYDAAACCALFLLTCALPATPLHSDRPDAILTQTFGTVTGAGAVAAADPEKALDMLFLAIVVAARILPKEHWLVHLLALQAARILRADGLLQPAARLKHACTWVVAEQLALGCARISLNPHDYGTSNALERAGEAWRGCCALLEAGAGGANSGGGGGGAAAAGGGGQRVRPVHSAVEQLWVAAGCGPWPATAATAQARAEALEQEVIAVRTVSGWH